MPWDFFFFPFREDLKSRFLEKIWAPFCDSSFAAFLQTRKIIKILVFGRSPFWKASFIVSVTNYSSLLFSLVINLSKQFPSVEKDSKTKAYSLNQKEKDKNRSLENKKKKQKKEKKRKVGERKGREQGRKKAG